MDWQLLYHSFFCVTTYPGSYSVLLFHVHLTIYSYLHGVMVRCKYSYFDRSLGDSKLEWEAQCYVTSVNELNFPIHLRLNVKNKVLFP